MKEEAMNEDRKAVIRRWLARSDAPSQMTDIVNDYFSRAALDAALAEEKRKVTELEDAVLRATFHKDEQVEHLAGALAKEKRRAEKWEDIAGMVAAQLVANAEQIDPTMCWCHVGSKAQLHVDYCARSGEAIAAYNTALKEEALSTAPDRPKED